MNIYAVYFCVQFNIDVTFLLQYEQVTPVSFVTSDAHLKLSGYKQQIMNCSFDFRSFNEGGMLLYNKFSQEGFVKVSFEIAKFLAVGSSF